MANRIVSVHAGIYGMGIYATMLPSSGFSVAHCAADRGFSGSGEMSNLELTSGRTCVSETKNNEGLSVSDSVRRYGVIFQCH